MKALMLWNSSVFPFYLFMTIRYFLVRWEGANRKDWGAREVYSWRGKPMENRWQWGTNPTTVHYSIYCRTKVSQIRLFLERPKTRSSDPPTPDLLGGGSRWIELFPWFNFKSRGKTRGIAIVRGRGQFLTVVPPYRETIFWPSGRPKKADSFRTRALGTHSTGFRATCTRYFNNFMAHYL